jgi:enoyl-CoA hydratase
MGLPLIHDDNGIRWITLDRPEIRNALRVEDLDHIADGVRSAGRHVRAIILTGAGDRAFSAGMHVKTFADATPESARKSIARVRDCLGAIRLSPRPTVALINGYCIGAGFEMALACDLRVAHPQVQFGLPEVKLGIPSVVDAALLQQFVGLSKAKEIILSGDMYPLADFAHTGIANRIVDGTRSCQPARLVHTAGDGRAERTVRDLAQQRPSAWNRHQRRCFRRLVRPPGNAAGDRAISARPADLIGRKIANPRPRRLYRQ